MSKRSRIKEVKLLLGSDADESVDINGMFEEMMGMKDAEPEIILPKFVQTRNTLRHVNKLLNTLTDFLRDDFCEFSEELTQIATFTTEMKNSVYLMDEDETEVKYQNLSKTELNELYKKLKENTYVKRLIVLCGRLKQYNKAFENVKAPHLNFVGQEPGLDLIIFDFSNLDLKKLWVAPKMRDVVKKFFLNVMHLLYKDLFLIYKITTSPDVDIDRFSDVLFASISKLEKQPTLDRCKNAFKRIKNSISLLKDKFDDYYRESIASSNPNMILESFVIDVSNQGNTDASLTREFRFIIQYMNKMSQQNGRNKDPKVQKLFSMLQKNMDRINTPKDPPAESKISVPVADVVPDVSTTATPSVPSTPSTPST